MKKLGFGLMRLPLLNADDPSSVDIETFKQMVDVYLERGFTYFDTAWMYADGKSEEAVREALVKRYPRGSFILTDKLPAYILKTPEDREKVFNEQLRRTGAGYFDYYFLHDVNADSIRTFEALDCFSFISKKKAQGLVKHIGFSFHDSPEMLDALLTAHPEVELVQLQINYLDWDSLGIQSRKCYETAVKHGKPVSVMEPVKGGTLAALPEEAEKILKAADADASAASWAIRFAATNENVMLVLSGMSNMEQLNDNTGFMADFKPLTKQEWDMMMEVRDIISSSIAIPCTGCAYCTAVCPQDIPIPRYFSFYNNDVIDSAQKKRTPLRAYYQRLTLSEKKASECLECGACESMCPQHLKVREYLKQVAARFE